MAVDQEKAALGGTCAADAVARTLRTLTAGEPVGLLHAGARQGGRAHRAAGATAPPAPTSTGCAALRVAGRGGALVPLGELVRAERTVAERSIYHKNLMPVVYVTADVAGAIESPVYAISKLGAAARRP